MNFGDIVIYHEGGETHNATVLSVRSVNNHMGSDNEPVLDLAFFKPVMQFNASGDSVPKSVVGTSAQHELVQFRNDVVHVSHDSGEGKPYPGGRWTEEFLTSRPPFQPPVSQDEEEEMDSLEAGDEKP